jgi:NADPH:quinone reductase-like Zn-dependent oxidoreductase
MKALRFEKYGPPSVLSIQQLRVPDLKTGEALVELHASAINPSDVKNVAGVFKASLPRVPGRDFAGVVVAGDGWKGKEVWGSGPGLSLLLATGGQAVQPVEQPSPLISRGFGELMLITAGSVTTSVVWPAIRQDHSDSNVSPALGGA